MSEESPPSAERCRPRVLTPRAACRRAGASIIEAAVAVYADKGYEDVVEDIAARASVSRRTIYVHFKDLDDLGFRRVRARAPRNPREPGTIATETMPGDRLVTVLTEASAGARRPKLSHVVASELE